MASSYSNLMAEHAHTWQFRTAFSDAWVSDVFTRETDTLTKALPNSFPGVTSGEDGVSSAEMHQSLSVKSDATPLHTPTVSGVSENERPAPRHHRRSPPASGGRVAKRKSRPSKRASATTFIAADPANFRRMVQQVTGVGFGGESNEQQQMLKNEAHRAVNYQAAHPAFGLPTLDSSTFFVDGSASSQPSVVVDDGGAAAAAEHYFDSFCSFPTLESWKAM